jgi:transforming growth factor-beta-induced protein
MISRQTRRQPQSANAPNSRLLGMTFLSAAVLLTSALISPSFAKEAPPTPRVSQELPRATPEPAQPMTPSQPMTPGQPMAPTPSKSPAPAETKTISELAVGNPSFTTLVKALKAAGLVGTLAAEGPYTVFAPTDAAFAALPKGTVEKLLKPENKAKLIKLLTYHVVPGTVLASDLQSGDVKSLQGSTIAVKVSPQGATVNNANVVIADVKAKNGVIHAIDQVIMPSESQAVKPQSRSTNAAGTITDIAAKSPSFKTLTAALKAAGLTETLSSTGPFTVFAPTDAAFAALPAGTLDKLLLPENKDLLIKVLSYHVVSGQLMSKDLKAGPLTSVEGASIAVKVGSKGIMVNNAMVATGDVKASNGVIHAIDKVILPPSPSAQKPGSSKSAPGSAAGTAPGSAGAPMKPAEVKPTAVPGAPIGAPLSK